MARTYYYVVSSGSEWEVKFDGQKPNTRYPYATQDQAIQAARLTATKNWEEHGQLSGVRIQRVGGQWRDEWTYGEDPHPPRG